MAGRIPGINRTNLWQAWKAIRRELKRASVRDAVDFLEYDINPERWIRELLKEIEAGTYEPTLAHRFYLTKPKGFSRQMTFPSIPDLVLYRAIVDYLYQRARRHQQRHVYFDAADLQRVTTAATIAARQLMGAGLTPYGPRTISTFLAWLRYAQYRKQLIFRRVYPFIVVTDIANFFDTTLHSRIAESLYGIPASPRMVGLLLFLLDRLASRGDYAGSPRDRLARGRIQLFSKTGSYGSVSPRRSDGDSCG